MRMRETSIFETLNKVDVPCCYGRVDICGHTFIACKPVCMGRIHISTGAHAPAKSKRVFRVQFVGIVSTAVYVRRRV